MPKIEKPNNLEKHKIFNARFSETDYPHPIQIVLNFDKMKEAKEFWKWLNTEAK